jgi:hypothetical protein
MIEMGGGGVAALGAFFSGAEIAAASAAFLVGGVVLVFVGLGCAAYVGYRLITQAKGFDGLGSIQFPIQVIALSSENYA